MATPTLKLIDALRETAHRLKNGSFYAWGNHGACNCGNLIQVITEKDRNEVLKIARLGVGEWSDLALDFGEWSNENQAEYCTTTGNPLDMVFSELAQLGLSAQDIHDLEYLENKEVLKRLKGGFRYLQRNVREDAVAYFEAFAMYLEELLAEKMNLNVEELMPKATLTL